MHHDASLIVKVSFVDESIDDARFFVNVNDDNGWSGVTFFLDEFIGEEIDIIGLEFLSPDGATGYDVHVGQIKVHEGEAIPLSIEDITQNTNDVEVYYQVNSDTPITLVIDWQSRQDLSYKMYSIEGKLITQNTIAQQEQSHYALPTSTIASGIYLLAISDGQTQIVKKIRVR